MRIESSVDLQLQIEGIFMHETRKKIKHRFIGDLGINPRDYDIKRGDVQPYKDQYVYDEFDKIIIKTANDLFKATSKSIGNKKFQKRQGKKLDVFWYLYACRDHKETSICVLKKKNGKLYPIKEETVRRYERDIIKILIDYFENDEKIKAKIYKAIKNEYSKYEFDETKDN
jgi:hypothetical protein